METILVVDDDNQVRGVIREYLTRCGYDVIDAPDGNRALELMDERHVDVVVCDIFMPRREGLSTMSEIRRRNPNAKIVVMSGGRQNEQALLILELGKQFGATAGLQKPFQLEILGETIERLLGRGRKQAPATHP